MRCLTIPKWAILCLCSSMLTGCAVNQTALFSIPPELDKSKIEAISQSVSVRNQSLAKKTIESVKPDQFRVTGFNKAVIQRKNEKSKEAIKQAEKKEAIDSDLEYEALADFQAIELVEFEIQQELNSELDLPIEAKKPVIEEPILVLIAEEEIAEEVSFKAVKQVQNEEKKAETAAKDAELVELGLKPLRSLSISVKPPTGELPKNTAAAHLDKIPRQVIVMGTSRDWNLVTKEWEAPSVAYNPLYFEEPNLERFGYNYGVAQPFISAGRFFGRVALLPYMIGAYPLHEDRYALGYARPGDNPPYQVEKLPVSGRGAIFQSLAVTGLVFLIP